MLSPSLWCSTMFFSSRTRSLYVYLFSLSFSFTLWLAGSVCISKYQRILCVSIFGKDSGLGIYHLFYGQISISSSICIDHLYYCVESSLLIYLPSSTVFAYYMTDIYLYHHIIYICYFIASCLFMLWQLFLLLIYFIDLHILIIIFMLSKESYTWSRLFLWLYPKTDQAGMYKFIDNIILSHFYYT